MNDFSVCIIAKNEETCIERCLKSLTPLNAEIIVVDTGSTDHTKEIAGQYTSSVYDFDWNSDFSSARNFSIQKATNDWILIIDCDEWITEFELPVISSFMKQNAQSIGLVTHHNIMKEKDSDSIYTVSLERFFNRNYYHYEGAIHEQICAKENIRYSTLQLSISMYHDGYCHTLINSQVKFERNVSIIQKQLKKHPNDPYLLFQLGQSYYHMKQYAQAVIYFEKAMEQPLNYKSQAAQTIVYNWINCLNELHRSKEALSILPHYQDLCEYADFPLLLGHVYTNIGQYLNAMSEYLRATTIPKYHIQGANSFLPLYYIGNLNAALGNIEMAKTMYEKCGNFHPAIQALKNIKDRK